MSRFFLATPLALLLVACSGSQSESETAAPKAQSSAVPRELRVLETFEVGQQVYVRALTVDKAANQLWVGTSLGAQRIDLNSFDVVDTWTRSNGLANEYVFTALVDSHGEGWVGTNGGGLSHLHDGAWKTYFPMHGLADYWVYSLAEAAPGTLWIGTWAGANRLDISSGRFETFHDELVNEWVYGIDVDAKGRVWFGTEGGISMFDGERWQEWKHKDGLGAPNRAGLPSSTNTGLGTRTRHDLSVTVDGGASYNPDYVFCIHAARNGSVWAGTWGGGVSRYDGSAWSNLTSDDGLVGNIVFAIAEDAAGVLWFGTESGLSRYENGHWRNFGTGDGLPDGAIYAVAVTPAGEVWAGGKGGVARIGSAP
ncbi:MAG: hypothetical protein LBV36_07945 [Chromatiales bacterium]|jgi:ligand-binding sensor domain-containing protein|nr:hypothetical protein [Chromatiales bacterium]